MLILRSVKILRISFMESDATSSLVAVISGSGTFICQPAPAPAACTPTRELSNPVRDKRDGVPQNHHPRTLPGARARKVALCCFPFLGEKPIRLTHYRLLVWALFDIFFAPNR